MLQRSSHLSVSGVTRQFIHTDTHTHTRARTRTHTCSVPQPAFSRAETFRGVALGQPPTSKQPGPKAQFELTQMQTPTASLLGLVGRGKLAAAGCCWLLLLAAGCWAREHCAAAKKGGWLAGWLAYHVARSFWRPSSPSMTPFSTSSRSSCAVYS